MTAVTIRDAMGVERHSGAIWREAYEAMAQREIVGKIVLEP